MYSEYILMYIIISLHKHRDPRNDEATGSGAGQCGHVAAAAQRPIVAAAREESGAQHKHRAGLRVDNKWFMHSITKNTLLTLCVHLQTPAVASEVRWAAPPSAQSGTGLSSRTCAAPGRPGRPAGRRPSLDPAACGTCSTVACRWRWRRSEHQFACRRCCGRLSTSAGWAERLDVLPAPDRLQWCPLWPIRGIQDIYVVCLISILFDFGNFLVITQAKKKHFYKFKKKRYKNKLY